MSGSGEIEPTSMRCNACWKGIGSGKCYKTGCNHLFCRPCAERFFSKKMICPLCDASVDGEGGVIELFTERSIELASLAFGYAAFHTTDALSLLPEINWVPHEPLQDSVAFARGVKDWYYNPFEEGATNVSQTAPPVQLPMSLQASHSMQAAEAIGFARSQTALYGTREIWLRGKEAEGVQRKLVDCENRLNSVMSELAQKAKEAAELGEKLVAKAHVAEEAERKARSLERLYAQATGKHITTITTGSGGAGSVISGMGGGQGMGGMQGMQTPLGGHAGGLHGQSGLQLGQQTPMGRSTGGGGGPLGGSAGGGIPGMTPRRMSVPGSVSSSSVASGISGSGIQGMGGSMMMQNGTNGYGGQSQGGQMMRGAGGMGYQSMVGQTPGGMGMQQQQQQGNNGQGMRRPNSGNGSGMNGGGRLMSPNGMQMQPQRSMTPPGIMGARLGIGVGPMGSQMHQNSGVRPSAQPIPPPTPGSSVVTTSNGQALRLVNAIPPTPGPSQTVRGMGAVNPLFPVSGR